MISPAQHKKSLCALFVLTRPRFNQELADVS